MIENRKIKDMFTPEEFDWLISEYPDFTWTFTRTHAGVFKVICKTTSTWTRSVSYYIDYPFDLFDLKRVINKAGACLSEKEKIKYES